MTQPSLSRVHAWTKIFVEVHAMRPSRDLQPCDSTPGFTESLLLSCSAAAIIVLRCATRFPSCAMMVNLCAAQPSMIAVAATRPSDRGGGGG